MDRNEALSVIQRFLTCRDIRTDDCCGHCETCRHNTEYDEKTEALQLAIKALEQAPKWIHVSKEMPKKEDCPMDCLVTRKSKTIGNYTDMAVAEKSGTWTHEDWEAIVLGDNVSGKKTGLLNTRGDEIVAWMPLPEPYKEGEQHETD